MELISPSFAFDGLPSSIGSSRKIPTPDALAVGIRDMLCLRKRASSSCIDTKLLQRTSSLKISQEVLEGCCQIADDKQHHILLFATNC